MFNPSALLTILLVRTLIQPPSLFFRIEKKLGRGEMLEISHYSLEQGESFAELLPLVFGEPLHGFGKGLHAAFARFPHEADSFRRRFEAHAASVIRGMPPQQPGALEASDDAAHRGRADLFGVGEFAERLWAAEDKYGQRGELGGANPTLPVANTKPTQQVNRGGVKLIGDLHRRQCRRQRGRGEGLQRWRGVKLCG
jgi:hypothetical protein